MGSHEVPKSKKLGQPRQRKKQIGQEESNEKEEIQSNLSPNEAKDGTSKEFVLQRSKGPSEETTLMMAKIVKVIHRRVIVPHVHVQLCVIQSIWNSRLLQAPLAHGTRVP